MKRILLAALLISASFTSFAQITQEGRVEIELKEGGVGGTAAMGESGLLVFGKSEASNEIFEITHYDTEFARVAKTTFSYNKRSSLLTHLFTNDGKEVLFVFTNKEKLEVVRYNIAKSTTSSSKHKLRFKIDAAYLLNNSLFLQGMLKKKPVVATLDLASGTSKLLMLPGGGKNTRIKDIAVDHQQQVVAISVQHGPKRDLRKWVFEIALFNVKGNKLGSPIIIENELNRYTLDADITWMNKDEFLISGNYSTDGSMLSNGLFLAAFRNGRQVFIRYHNFADMPNFFQYLSKKRKAKAEKQVAKKKEKGKDNAVRVHMTTHKISEFGGQYVVLGEAYYPTYRTEVMTSYVNGTPQTTTRQVFDGYQYTHATVLGLDKQGNKLWDHCFELEIPNRPYYVRQNIRGLATENEIRLFYPSGLNLKSMIIAKDNSFVEKNLGKLQTQRAGDKVKRDEFPDMKYWYQDYFLLSGSQRIKNAQDKSTAKNRRVFYLAKIKVDSQYNPSTLDNETAEDDFLDDED